MAKVTKIRPLRRRTYTVETLTDAALKFIKKVRKQLQHTSWDIGMTDKEFLDVVGDFEIDLRQDREMRKMLAENNK